MKKEGLSFYKATVSENNYKFYSHLLLHSPIVMLIFVPLVFKQWVIKKFLNSLLFKHKVHHIFFKLSTQYSN